MGKISTLFFLKIFFIFLLISACSKDSSQEQFQSIEGSGVNLVPQEYVNKVNPYSDIEKLRERGKESFQKYCASCHGENGEGNGPAAVSLDPKPQNLKDTQSKVADNYLFWRISEGGSMDPFKSSMPPWKSLLNDQQIWEIITFIRSISR